MNPGSIPRFLIFSPLGIFKIILVHVLISQTTHPCKKSITQCMAGLYFDCTQFLFQYLYLLMLLNQIQSNWIPLSLCSECSLEKYVLTVPKPFVIYFARCFNQKDEKRLVFITIVWKRIRVTYSEIMQSEWLKRITRLSATNHDGSYVSLQF